MDDEKSPIIINLHFDYYDNYDCANYKLLSIWFNENGNFEYFVNGAGNIISIDSASKILKVDKNILLESLSKGGEIYEINQFFNN